jgi:hypothetical protein
LIDLFKVIQFLTRDRSKLTNQLGTRWVAKDQIQGDTCCFAFALGMVE